MSTEVENTVVAWIFLAVLLMVVGLLMPTILTSLAGINFTAIPNGEALQAMFQLIPFFLGVGIFIKVLKEALS